MFSRLKRGVVAVTVLLIAGIAGWLAAGYYLEGDSIIARIPLIHSLLIDSTRDADRKTEEKRPETAGPDLMVKLYLPEETGLREEGRRNPGEVLSVRLAEYLVAEYLKSLPGRLGDTRILGIYKDRDNILYIDLSDDFRRNFAGDARQEFYLLKALYETISRNMPAVQDVVLLSEGREVESIGGHFSLLKPMKAVFGEQRQ